MSEGRNNTGAAKPGTPAGRKTARPRATGAARPRGTGTAGSRTRTARKGTSVRKKSAVKRQRAFRLPAWAAWAIAAAIAILVLFPTIRLLRGRGTEPIPKGYTAVGIDLSHHNGGTIQWDSLKVLTDAKGRTTKDIRQAAGARKIAFVCLKATEGETMRDKDFAARLGQARSHGIRTGAYHFFRTSKDAALQAENFIAAAGDLRHGDLPPVLDIETVHRGCSKAELNRKALIWLRQVERHYGRKPVVYTYDNFAARWLSPQITSDYPVWIARYGGKKPIFGKWSAWQFTDKGLVVGIDGRVDLSVMAKDNRL